MVEKRYVLIKNEKPLYVEKEVTEMMEQGWVCLGGPITCKDFIIQAMIKESK